MKFPPDFHNYAGFNGLVNSFSQFTITPPNKLILGCKPHGSAIIIIIIIIIIITGPGNTG